MKNELLNVLNSFKFKREGLLILKEIKALKNIIIPPIVIARSNILFRKNLFSTLSLLVNFPAVETSINHQIIHPVNMPRIRKYLFIGLIRTFDRCKPVNMAISRRAVVGFASDIKNVEVNVLNSKLLFCEISFLLIFFIFNVM